MEERNIEQELMEIKREINSFRDKSIAAKAVIQQTETQIKDILSGIESLIVNENDKNEFSAFCRALEENLMNEEAATNLLNWVNNYVAKIAEQNDRMVASLKADIEKWKEIIK